MTTATAPTPAQAQARYSSVARLLHWTIALLIIANIPIGLTHDALGKVFPGTMMVHKSIGLTVLALTLARIAWRLAHRPPPLPAEMPGWEKGAAHGTHAVFYLLMLIMPLTGWIMSSSGSYPLSWFGLFPVPKFAVTKGDPIVGFAHEAHELLGWLWAALILLHVAAALRHHFLLRDGVLRRMV